jgi:ankyrin repeat protein
MQKDTVHVLIQKGADVSVADMDEWTPLHVAASKDLAIVKLVYEAGGNIHAQANNSGTVLYEAVVEGQRTIAEWLLSLGADVLATNNDGWTPLHGVASKDLAAAKVVHEAGGHIHARTVEGYTALHMSARFGGKDLVDFMNLRASQWLAVAGDWSSGRGGKEFRVYGESQSKWVAVPKEHQLVSDGDICIL